MREREEVRNGGEEWKSDYGVTSRHARRSTDCTVLPIQIFNGVSQQPFQIFSRIEKKERKARQALLQFYKRETTQYRSRVCDLCVRCVEAEGRTREHSLCWVNTHREAIQALKSIPHQKKSSSVSFSLAFLKEFSVISSHLSFSLPSVLLLLVFG